MKFSTSKDRRDWGRNMRVMKNLSFGFEIVQYKEKKALATLRNSEEMAKTKSEESNCFQLGFFRIANNEMFKILKIFTQN